MVTEDVPHDSNAERIVRSKEAIWIKKLITLFLFVSSERVVLRDLVNIGDLHLKMVDQW